MEDKDIQKMLKLARIDKNIASKDIAEYIQISNSSITSIEKDFIKNSRIKYLTYLRSKGVDLNAIFDAINGLNIDNDEK